MTTGHKYFVYKGKEYHIFRCPDGVWRDDGGTAYGVSEDEASVDENSVCGIGAFSLPSSHPANAICSGHDSRYSIPLWEMNHSQLEDDIWLREELKAKGYPILAIIFFPITRAFGWLFREG